MRHRFHALCPYFAMFPETFAEEWLNKLTKPGQVVLDPFCGRGTLPFQALLMRRRAVGCDLNPVAYCVTRAKTRAPDASVARRRVSQLESAFDEGVWEAEQRQLPEFFEYAYRPAVARQLLFLRSLLDWKRSDTDCMIAALILGALHGESNHSDAYLSNQMPHTIATKPAYSVRFWVRHGYEAPRRNVFGLLRERIEYRYASGVPNAKGRVIHADMRDLPRQGDLGGVRCVITSPPYFDVTSYEEDQWLRLWFLGGPAHPTRGRISRDDRHENRDHYWSMIGDMWRTLGKVLRPNSDVVVRIGAVRLKPSQLTDGLEGTSVLSARRVRLLSRKTSSLAKRQTDSFRPGSSGCKVEVDCHFRVH